MSRFLKKGKEMVSGVKDIYKAFSNVRPCMYSGLVSNPIPLLLFDWESPSPKEGFENTPWGKIETNLGTYKESPFQTNCESKFHVSKYHAYPKDQNFHRFFVAKVKMPKRKHNAQMWTWEDDQEILKQIKNAKKYHFDTFSIEEAMYKLAALTVNERKNGFPYEEYSKWMPWKKSGIKEGQDIFVLVPAEDLNFFKKEKVSFHEDTTNLNPGKKGGRWDDLDERAGRIALADSMRFRHMDGLSRKRKIKCGTKAATKEALLSKKKPRFSKCTQKKIRDENHDVDLDNEARIKMRVHPDFTNTIELKFEKTKFNNLKLGYKVEKKFRHIVSDDEKDPYENILNKTKPKTLKEAEKEIDQDSLEDLIEIPGTKEYIKEMEYDEWGCPPGMTGCGPHSLPPLELEEKIEVEEPIGLVDPKLREELNNFKKEDPRPIEINPPKIKEELMREDPPFKGLPPEYLKAAYLGRDCETDADCTEWNRNNGLICHEDAQICIDKTDTSYDDDSDFDSDDVVEMLTGKSIKKITKSNCKTIKKKSSCKKNKKCYYSKKRKKCKTRRKK